MSFELVTVTSGDITLAPTEAVIAAPRAWWRMRCGWSDRCES